VRQRETAAAAAAAAYATDYDMRGAPTRVLGYTREWDSRGRIAISEALAVKTLDPRRAFLLPPPPLPRGELINPHSLRELHLLLCHPPLPAASHVSVCRDDIRAPTKRRLKWTRVRRQQHVVAIAPRPPPPPPRARLSKIFRPALRFDDAMADLAGRGMRDGFIR